MAEGQCCNLLSSIKNNWKSLWSIRTPTKGCFTELFFHWFLFIHTPELNSFYKSYLVTVSIPIHFSLAPDAELHDMPLYDIIPLKNYSWHLSPVLPQSFLIRQFVTQQCRRFAPARQNSSCSCIIPWTFYFLWAHSSSTRMIFIPLPWPNTSQKTYSAKSHFVILGKHMAIFSKLVFPSDPNSIKGDFISKCTWTSLAHLTLKL